MQLPVARTSELIEQDADNELLIYDLRINKAYTLNKTSKVVFNACNTKTSFNDLKRAHKYTDELIYLALDELKKNNLIEGDYASPFAGMNRREVVKKVGLASMIALPLVTGLIAPSAAHAQSASAGSIGSACGGGATCSTGLVCCGSRGNTCRSTVIPGSPACTAATDCCIPAGATATACVSGRCCLPAGQNNGGAPTRCCNATAGSICS